MDLGLTLEDLPVNKYWLNPAMNPVGRSYLPPLRGFLPVLGDRTAQGNLRTSRTTFYPDFIETKVGTRHG